jgi:hypothetical protein
LYWRLCGLEMMAKNKSLFLPEIESLPFSP